MCYSVTVSYSGHPSILDLVERSRVVGAAADDPDSTPTATGPSPLRSSTPVRTRSQATCQPGEVSYILKDIFAQVLIFVSLKGSG